MHAHASIIELVAGSVAETLFLPGKPWPAESDRAKERALASLVCSSPESVEAFIAFCRAEAAALLRPREHIVRALTAELIERRTMTGPEIDAVIAAAVQAKAADDERQRRSAWARICVNASTFTPDGCVPKYSP
jgi:hypothetical protein